MPIMRMIDRIKLGPKWMANETNNGCWEWKFGKDGRGYGNVRHNGKMEMAHRIVYEHMVGPIPKGMFVCHKCDNPPCVNPSHMFIGNYKDNNKDRADKGRNGKKPQGIHKQDFCKRGHSRLDKLNITNDGHCAECQRIRCRNAYRNKQKGIGKYVKIRINDGR